MVGTMPGLLGEVGFAVADVLVDGDGFDVSGFAQVYSKCAEREADVVGRHVCQRCRVDTGCVAEFD